MSKNIKEIGKELLGKSLNSYHRRTGLTQLEENNKMQDGILNGILSQVDDAYIEKTEQSNVIHLDGSGDGVVVLDSIEGNTMVNILKYKNIQWVDGGWNDYVRKDQLIQDLKTNTEYTIVVDVSNWNYNQGITLCCDDTNVTTYFKGNSIPITGNGRYIAKRTTKADFSTLNIYNILYSVHNPDTINGTCNVDMMIFEGDWTDKEIPPYFEGLQSSFEEKVNDEGKYEIEILMKNKNLLDLKNPVNVGGYAPAKMEGDKIVLNSSGVEGDRISLAFPVYMKKGSTYRFSYSNIEGNSEVLGATVQMHPNLSSNGQFGISTKNPFTWDKESGIYYARIYNMYIAGTVKANIQLEENNVATTYIEPKQNKIKLLLNEPLRGTTAIKDKLVIKDSKLMIERNYREIIFNGTQRLTKSNNGDNTYMFAYMCQELKLRPNNTTYHAISDKLPYLSGNEDVPHIRANGSKPYGNVVIYINKSDIDNTTTNEYFKNNPIKAIFNTLEPYYEEVTNEYGEPIILEGYENGTIYIDSTIVPTTTVKYTPKMESLNTLKEVYNNNVMLTSDVNDNIIPYMMDVDLMIMEKEMALMSHKNIRKMEVLDMTSMQKRTQEMLERLIKGKSLTEQECKTRITTYLNAGKITDEQAEELMLLIDEVYA